MRKVTLVILVSTLCLTLAFPGFAQEKRVWGKQNIWAKELTEHLTRLYGSLTELLDRGLSEELGDPDFLGKMKEELQKRFHPELIPEGCAEVEQFATDFVSYIIDTHRELKQEWLADENFIEEIKKTTIENMSSWSRCPQALAPKLFEGWRIQALPPVHLGVKFESREAIYMEPADPQGEPADPQGPIWDAEVFYIGNIYIGNKKFLGKVRDLWETFSFRVNSVNDQRVDVSSLEEFLSFLHGIMWELYPGDIVTLKVFSVVRPSGDFILSIPVGKRDKWLILPES